jgi:hypothetical protein
VVVGEGEVEAERVVIGQRHEIAVDPSCSSQTEVLAVADRDVQETGGQRLFGESTLVLGSQTRGNDLATVEVLEESLP